MGLFSSKKYDVYDGKRLKNAYNVRYLKISSRVIGIDDQTFMYFKYLGEVIIPKSVEFIGKEAFKGCESLLEVEMPDSIMNVGEGAFEDCAALRKVRVSERLGNISKQMFANCKVLTWIGIPESVKAVEEDAFYGCSSLQTIVFESPEPPTLYRGIMEQVGENCKIYVPEKYIDKYRAENEWHEIQNRIWPIDKNIEKLFK